MVYTQRGANVLTRAFGLNKLLYLLLAASIFYGAVSIASNHELLESCLTNTKNKDLSSCQKYIGIDEIDTADLAELAKSYRDKGEFEISMWLYEHALRLGASSRVSTKAKTTKSLITTKSFIDEQQFIDSGRSTSDTEVMASRADRLKCIRFSKIKPDLAHEACTRYMNSVGKNDPEVENADNVAKAALGISDIAKAAPAPAPVPKHFSEKSLVTQSQLYLTRLGYTPGAVDGEFGARTSDAIRSYQRANDLAVTGEPSSELVENMRLQIEKRQKTVASVNLGSPSLSPKSSGVVSPAQDDSSVSDDQAELRAEIAELTKLISAKQSRPAQVLPAQLQIYAEQGTRKALVIGNWKYPSSLGMLHNPGNDAKIVASTVESLGFETTTILNGSLQDMEIAVRDFSRSVKPGDTVVFYYAGHGAQIQGVNYLIPTGMSIDDAIDIKYKSLDLSYVMTKVSKNIRGVTIVILDACPPNPFVNESGPVQKGWAVTRGSVGTLIGYATAPGEVGIDGVGDNGLYTASLVRLMQEPDLKIEDMFKKIRVAVEKESRGKQIPWEYSLLVGDFFFVPPRS